MPRTCRGGATGAPLQTAGPAYLMRNIIKQYVLPQSRRAAWHKCIKAKALNLWCTYARAPLDKAGFAYFSRVTARYAAVIAFRRLSVNRALKKITLPHSSQVVWR